MAGTAMKLPVQSEKSLPATPGEMPKPKQVTKGKYSEGNLTWSPDGSRFYFVARRVADTVPA